MSIFVVYDDHMIWHKVYNNFDEAVDQVRLATQGYNESYKMMEDWDGEWEPAKMEEEFKYVDAQGGVLVAFNEREKICVFIKELTY